MKIACFEVNDWEEALIKKNFKGHALKIFNEAFNAENAHLAKDCESVSVFIYSKVSADAIAKIPQLKLITTRSTGFDHIDLGVCKSKNIIVCNVPNYGENTVAEHAFALLLALSRKTSKSYARALKGDFSIDGLKGFDLMEKTFGIVGSGKIGLNAIKIAKGFGMKVVAYDVFENTFMKNMLDFEYVSLKELLKVSDVISLHAPYNKDTHHLINKKNINDIKKGAVLINTARGQLVETDAILYGLNKGILSGVGLDVLEGEDLVKNEKALDKSKLTAEQVKLLEKAKAVIAKEDVIFTPHMAFFTTEALTRIVEITAKNIELFVKNTPQNLVK
jgi:D-lactate dehydrogenase